MAEESSETLDHSKKYLKKIEKATENQARTIVTLILDENELQRLDSIDSYTRLENLSVCRNNLMRMYGVGRLTSLRHLNLSNNSIITLEGLKELVYLKKLELSCNNIKSIEQLNNNINLEYLDLSGNQISHITDISFLKYLKHLYLDKNLLSNLKQCERYLPTSLVTLGLANNVLTDLNTICHLSHLGQLEIITVEGNPCLKPIPGQEKIEFDYRPFVKNWVMNVKMVDGYAVNALESLKAEWLYSQGRGRQFHEGEQEQLVQYLCSTCPYGDLAPETEEQRKLRLILSKAQHYQQQLREQGPSPPRANKHSPRMQARITARMVTKSPDRGMSSSYHSALSNKHHNSLIQQSNQMSASFSGEISSNNITPTKSIHSRIFGDMNPAMSQSFDSSAVSAILNSESEVNRIISEKCFEKVADMKENKEIVEHVVKEEIRKESKIDSIVDSNKALNQPLEAASKMVPVPDSLMSPDYQGPLFVAQPGLILGQNPQGMIMNRRISGNTQVYNPNSPLVHNSHLSGNQVQSYIPNTTIASPHSNSHSDLPIMNCSGNRNKTATQKTATVSKGAVGVNMRNNKGSPQLSRSAMSSPKLRNCNEQRKGSFSSRLPQQNNEEIQSAKNLYNQTLQTTLGATSNFVNKKNNGINKTINTLSSQMEIQVTPPNTQGGNSSDEDSEMCVEKLQSIKDAAYQRRQKQSISDSGSSEGVATATNKSGNKKGKSPHCAAVTIQKLWRGYRTRNLNQKTGSIMHSIQTMRARQYIEKLSCDMEATKAALDSERKIQQLQMQAINALWKKISAMEVSCGKGEGDSCPKDILSFSNEKSDDKSTKDDAVRELTQTCSMLQAQVQQLQGSMRDILQFVSSKHSGLQSQLGGGGIATQTEISAVHTPQGESSGNWPYHKTVSRPCSLSLAVQNNNFKQKHSQESEKSESVQTEIKENDSGTATAENEVQLPGQTDKMSADSAKEKTSLGTDIENIFVNSAPILKVHIENHSEDGSGDIFGENLKKECLGVASSEKDLNQLVKGDS